MTKLTVGLDFRPALSRATGVGRYFEGLVSGLQIVDADNDYVLFSSSWKERARRESRPSNFRLVDRRVPVRVLNALWHWLRVPSLDWLADGDLDVAHSPTPLRLPARRARSVVTICDLFFLEHPEATGAEIRRDYVRLVRAHVESADAIVAISETTADDIVQKLGVAREKITVIHAGLDPRFQTRSGETNGRRDDYLLVVATLEPRKNIPALLEALSILKSRGFTGTLRIAGGDGLDTNRVNEWIERFDLGELVERLGYVDLEALVTLYQRARAVVMPSRWEGFGLPLLEAMASGAPIVASDIPVHREVAGDAALFVEATEPEALADAIARAWSDQELRRSLSEKGRERVKQFSWEAAAAKAVALYARVGRA